MHKSHIYSIYILYISKYNLKLQKEKMENYYKKIIKIRIVNSFSLIFFIEFDKNEKHLKICE